MLEDKYVVWIMALEARASDESELMLGQICRIGTGYNVVTGNRYFTMRRITLYVVC